MSAVGTTKAEDGHRAGMRAPSPRVRGEGWDEGAFPLGSDSRLRPPCGACHRAGHFGPDPLAIRPLPAQRGEERIESMAPMILPTLLG
jgi:hypothetical protein